MSPHLANTNCYCLLHCSHLSGYEVVSMVVLICIYLVANNIGHLFICLWPLVYFQWINVYSESLLILKLGICHFIIQLEELFCVFWIQVSYQIGFTNMFSHSVDCLSLSFLLEILLFLHSNYVWLHLGKLWTLYGICISVTHWGRLYFHFPVPTKSIS